ncbi:MAG: hypothetical protein V4615_05380, partial [Bacteroidota bacterium]
IQPAMALVKLLHGAAAQGMIEVVQCMIMRKLVDVNALDPSGQYTVTPAEGDSYTAFHTGGGTCLQSYISENEDLAHLPALIKMLKY